MRRRTLSVAATLQKIVANTLSLTASAGGVAFVACDTSVDDRAVSMADAMETAPSMDQSTDSSQTDVRRQDSTVDSADATDAGLIRDAPFLLDDGAWADCGVGYVSQCCWSTCWCELPQTQRWVACGGDAEAGACPVGQCSDAASQMFCPGQRCDFLAVEAGASLVECYNGDEACGRRPRGFVPPPVSGKSPMARYFAGCAQLEAASIDAFEILAAELEGFDAPRRLVREAKRAARDEIRHAMTMARLAGRREAMSERQKPSREARRSLRAVAIENCAEGCVRETYGALVAMWQARTAADVRVRRAMQRIGADEARHAQLAWDVQRWMNRRLSPAARRAVERARKDALGRLLAALGRSRPSPVARALGLPQASEALAMFERLAEAVADWTSRADAPG
jgi:hypothetical protein